jgi:Cu+-exporting ATPase
MGVALITFVSWITISHQFVMALTSTIAVLIIACPCALGLATPMSILVATGIGARVGILVKNAEALQKLESVNTIVIDKTGTLTEGKPKVVDLSVAASISEQELLRLVGSLERHSEHPIAKAIVDRCRQQAIPIKSATSYQAKPGFGATALVDEKMVLVGNALYLAEHKIAIDSFAEPYRELTKKSQTVIFAALDKKLVGLIALADKAKPEAKELVSRLNKKGYRLVVLTGDSQEATASLCKQVGVVEYKAELTPQQKARQIKQMQDEGACVAMAGDGINDAPALATANVGIAMGNGTDIAIDSADLVLLKGDLKALDRAITLSQAMMSNIRQNLWLAFLYNALAIPIAAGALYPICGLTLSPMIASAAMSLSSVSVIANALRLHLLKFAN